MQLPAAVEHEYQQPTVLYAVFDSAPCCKRKDMQSEAVVQRECCGCARLASLTTAEKTAAVVPHTMVPYSALYYSLRLYHFASTTHDDVLHKPPRTSPDTHNNTVASACTADASKLSTI